VLFRSAEETKQAATETNAAPAKKPATRTRRTAAKKPAAIKSTS
jgi:hypothetical protein